MIYTFTEFKQSIHSKRPHYFVIGNPVGHSLSPIMHQFALDTYQIDAVYVALQLHSSEVSSFAAWCNRDEFLGCNITIPFKHELLSVVDEVHPEASEIGAINTIVKKDGMLIAYNTDVYGFLKPLEMYLDSIELTRAIIFGTGGSSKAVKRGLEQLGFSELVFVTRSPGDKAILSDYSEIYISDYIQWTAFASDASLLVNTTPLGMVPKTCLSPVEWRDASSLSGKLCYDLIYNPPVTEFMKQAMDQKADCLNGLDMLIWQGSKSFQMWTGQPFPVDEIRKKLQNIISGS